MLLSCFVHERKHRVVKRYANDVLNTNVFEHTVLSEMVCDHVSQLYNPDIFHFGVGLIDPRPAKGAQLTTLMNEFGGTTFMSSQTAWFSDYARCTVGDVVLVKDGGSFVAGQVWGHFSVDGFCISVISLWALTARTAHACDWRKSDNPLFVSTDDILEATMWSRHSADIVRTLIPSSVLLRM